MLIDTMATLGLKVEPYLLYRESISGAKGRVLAPGDPRDEIGFLGAGDMEDIANMQGRTLPAETMLDRLHRGMLCLGVKRDGVLVAFTWCNLDECTIGGRTVLTLREDEAYLFDTYTVESRRGEGLAPLMRRRMLDELARIGRTGCYSATVTLNTPGRRFKEKLGAKVAGRGMVVELFRRWKFTFPLKRYS